MNSQCFIVLETDLTVSKKKSAEEVNADRFFTLKDDFRHKIDFHMMQTVLVVYMNLENSSSIWL